MGYSSSHSDRKLIRLPSLAPVVPFLKSRTNGAVDDSLENARGERHSRTASMYRLTVLSHSHQILPIPSLLSPLYVSLFPITLFTPKYALLLRPGLPLLRPSYFRHLEPSAALPESLRPFHSFSLCRHRRHPSPPPRTRRHRSGCSFAPLPVSSRARSNDFTLSD